MTQSRIAQKKNNKSGLKRAKKITLYTLLSLFLIAGGTLAFMVYKINSVTSGAQHELERGDRSDLRDTVVNPINDPVSILFLGLDGREGDLSGRTDAMILATFNPHEKSIKMLNIPRDSYVEIVGRDRMDKINHAHAFGGLDMTIDTVENLLDIPVDYFVSLNFDAFMDIIDEIGGVEVYVPTTFTERERSVYGDPITLYEGHQKLNGKEALAFVRMRKHDPRGDLGRGDRQKEMIEAIIKQGASFSTITRFGPIMDSIGENLNTNLSFNNILSMHSYATKLDNIDSLSFEGDNMMLNGIYYYQLKDESVAEISEILQIHLNLREAPPIVETEDSDNNDI
ncbi:MAG: LCP family protein [Bacillus sp. (in: Bacteria)]|nr:LCP family protein [Bacillus sp. (in: firmicutes)]